MMMERKSIILFGVRQERSASYSGELIGYREVTERQNCYMIGSFAPHLLSVYEELYDIVNIEDYRNGLL